MASGHVAYLYPHVEIWGEAIQAALGNQIDKVLKIFAQGYGWEVWAQIEVSVAMEHTLQPLDLYKSRKLEFQREECVYEGTKERCDILATFSWHEPAESIWHHFVELKCLSGRGLAYFIGELRKDIIKVKSAEGLKEKWARNAHYAAGEVLGITVNPRMTSQLMSDIDYCAREHNIDPRGDFDLVVEELLPKLRRPRLIPRPAMDAQEQSIIEALDEQAEISTRMEKLAQKEGIKWHHSFVDANRSIGIWRWERTFIVENIL